MSKVTFSPQTLILDDHTRIHAIPTGTVSVRPPHKEYHGLAGLRFPAILADWHWTEAMPIWTWVLETAHGTFLIDTGEKVQVLDPAYLGGAGTPGWVSKRILKIGILPEQQLDAQLAALGIAVSDIDRVILTHLHLDHTDGLDFVADRPVLISKSEWDQPFGAVLDTFPKNLKKELVTYTADDSPFGAGLAITPEITIVPTGGHTLGHQSVIFRHDGKVYFFAGDVAFSQAQLLSGHRAGIILDWDGAKKTYQHIRSLAQNEPVVFMPSHDPASVTRMMNGVILPR